MATRRHTLSVYHYISLVLVILLLASTRCEWVEISQNHYRKEPSRQETVNYNHEETTDFIIPYRNKSIIEKHWKKGVIDRVSPSVVINRRVHVPSEKTSSNQIEQNIFTKQASIHNDAPDQSYDSVIAETNILTKFQEEKLPTDPSEKISEPYHIHSGSAFERNRQTISFQEPHTANTNIFSRIESVNKGYITNVKKQIFYPDIESITSIYLKSSKNIGNITEETPQIKYQDESKMINNYEGPNGVINEQLVPKDSKLKDFSNTLRPIVPMNNPMTEKSVSFINRTEIDSEGTTSEAKTTHHKKQIQIDKHKESLKYDSSEEATTNSDGLANNKKGSTMKTMWKLIKVVTDSIYKSTRKGFTSKINYLESLKYNILSSIEDQVERTWPADNGRSYRRIRDTAGRGHVEFPSSESALMSISFLTFAVFLIKLVLQVIHTYKNKTMMVTPALVTAVGRAADAIKPNQQ